jgi:electron transfer flavoprotein beta subunit
MGAKQKPLDRPTVADLGLDALGGSSAGQKITNVAAAPERAAGEIVTDEGEAAKRIVDFLAERKVI